ncbi:MAG: thiamine-phosphate kinase [Thermodesulfovibrionales bacterium]
MLISELGELVLAKKVRDFFRIDDNRVIVSIGDDAAVFRAGEDTVVVTTDLMAEGVHFDYAYVTFYQVAFKLIVSNISDVYAMGGTPEYAFLNMAMVGDRTEDDFDEFLRGVSDACGYYDVKVIGGDISSSLKGDFYSATVVGSAHRSVLRSGARAGDSIFITGNTGDAAAGLAYLMSIKKRIPIEAGIEVADDHIDEHILRSVRRHLLPEAHDPKAFLPKANAMIDISDGLLIDLHRLCSESHTGALLYRDNIPVSEGARAVASLLHDNHMDYVLAGGEDYELLIASVHDEIEGCIKIGEIIEEGFFMQGANGNKEHFGPGGYTHF